MVMCRAISLLVARTSGQQYSQVILMNVRQTLASKNHRFFSASNKLFSDRRYTSKHEWVVVNGKIGTVGISNYAQEALGDVVFAQLPEVGAQVTQQAECGALESVKAASELFSPISGTVTEKNNSVEDTPGLINTSCYEKGWLFKVNISNADEITALMDEKKYNEYLKSAEH